MKVCRPWTRLEERRLRDLIAAGVRYPAAARVLGRGVKSVQMKGRRLVGPTPGRERYRHDDAVRRLSRRGWYDWEIALELGVCTQRVQRIRTRLGLPAASPRHSLAATKREEARRAARATTPGEC